MKKKVIISIVLVLVCSLAFIFIREQEKKLAVNAEDAGTSAHADKPITFINHDGRNYPIKKHYTSLLVIGTDKYEDQLFKDDDIELFYNEQCADFQSVVVIDDDEKAIYVIPVNRDTMTDVPYLDVVGEFAGYVNQQIALAYTYGSGKKDSAANCAHAVSKYLYGVPINYYMAFTMDSVPILNDAVGGVEVTIPKDMTAVDPSFKMGETVLLKGDKALKFVRARMILDELNYQRMDRFKLYLYGFIVSARNTYNDNPDMVLKVLDKVNPYLTTNMTAEKLSEVAQKLSDYELKPFESIDGETVINEVAEFYPDEESKWNAVRDAFCVKGLTGLW